MHQTLETHVPGDIRRFYFPLWTVLITPNSRRHWLPKNDRPDDYFCRYPLGLSDWSSQRDKEVSLSKENSLFRHHHGRTSFQKFQMDGKDAWWYVLFLFRYWHEFQIFDSRDRRCGAVAWLVISTSTSVPKEKKKRKNRRCRKTSKVKSLFSIFFLFHESESTSAYFTCNSC